MADVEEQIRGTKRSKFHVGREICKDEQIDTSGFLTALECTKFDFGRGSAPDPAGGAYSAPQTP